MNEGPNSLNKVWYDRDLALELGHAAAVLLNRFTWSIELKIERNETQYFREGKWWCYNTIEELSEYSAYSMSTVKRALSTLLSRGRIEKRQFDGANRQNYYSVVALQQVKMNPSVGQNEPLDNPVGQNEPLEEVKMNPSAGQNEPLSRSKWTAEEVKMSSCSLKSSVVLLESSQSLPKVCVQEDTHTLEGQADSLGWEDEPSFEAEDPVAISWHEAIKANIPTSKITIKELSLIASDARAHIKRSGIAESDLIDVLAYALNEGSEFQRQMFLKAPGKIFDEDGNGCSLLAEICIAYRRKAKTRRAF